MEGYSAVKGHVQVMDKTMRNLNFLNYQYKEEVLNKINKRTTLAENKMLKHIKKL